MSDKCQHGRNICYDCAFTSDIAKRVYGIIQAYVAFVPRDELVRSWVALRLIDGGSDGTLYLSKRDAVRHQSNEFLCAYFSFRNAPSGFASPKEAQAWLDFHRAAYDAGFRLPDPDAASGGPDLIMPLPNEDLSRAVRKLAA